MPFLRLLTAGVGSVLISLVMSNATSLTDVLLDATMMPASRLEKAKELVSLGENPLQIDHSTGLCPLDVSVYLGLHSLYEHMKESLGQKLCPLDSAGNPNKGFLTPLKEDMTRKTFNLMRDRDTHRKLILLISNLGSVLGRYIAIKFGTKEGLCSFSIDRRDHEVEDVVFLLDHDEEITVSIDENEIATFPPLSSDFYDTQTGPRHTRIPSKGLCTTLALRVVPQTADCGRSNARATQTQCRAGHLDSDHQRSEGGEARGTKDFRLIGHRGSGADGLFAHGLRENTIGSFNKAARDGAHAVEFGKVRPHAVSTLIFRRAAVRGRDPRPLPRLYHGFQIRQRDEFGGIKGSCRWLRYDTRR